MRSRSEGDQTGRWGHPSLQVSGSEDAAAPNPSPHLSRLPEPRVLLWGMKVPPLLPPPSLPEAFLPSLVRPAGALSSFLGDVMWNSCFRALSAAKPGPAKVGSPPGGCMAADTFPGTLRASEAGPIWLGSPARPPDAVCPFRAQGRGLALSPPHAQQRPDTSDRLCDVVKGSVPGQWGSEASAMIPSERWTRVIEG